MARRTLKRQPHLAEICTSESFFSGSMARHCGQWVLRLTCPECGRQTRMPANYLSNGKLMCTGERFLRPHEQTRTTLGHENMMHLLRRNP